MINHFEQKKLIACKYIFSSKQDTQTPKHNARIEMIISFEPWTYQFLLPVVRKLQS